MFVPVVVTLCDRFVVELESEVSLWKKYRKICVNIINTSLSMHKPLAKTSNKYKISMCQGTFTALDFWDINVVQCTKNLILYSYHYKAMSAFICLHLVCFQIYQRGRQKITKMNQIYQKSLINWQLYLKN